MMHHVPQLGLTALAVAGPVERVVRRQRTDCVNRAPVPPSRAVELGAFGAYGRCPFCTKFLPSVVGSTAEYNEPSYPLPLRPAERRRDF